MTDSTNSVKKISKILPAGTLRRIKPGTPHSSLLAIRKGKAAETVQTLTVKHRVLTERPNDTSGAHVFVSGYSKTYRPYNDEDRDRPDGEEKQVQQTVQSGLLEIMTSLTEIGDIDLGIAMTNATIRGDVIVDGISFFTSVPPEFLMILENRLNDLLTIASKLPILDTSKVWMYNPVHGRWETPATKTLRTRKIEKVLLLAAATPVHAAQAKTTTVDEPVGTWETTHYSGAIPMPVRTEIVRRVSAMRDAVKAELARINGVTAVKAEHHGTMEDVVTWVFNPAFDVIAPPSPTPPLHEKSIQLSSLAGF